MLTTCQKEADIKRTVINQLICPSVQWMIRVSFPNTIIALKLFSFRIKWNSISLLSCICHYDKTASFVCIYLDVLDLFCVYFKCVYILCKCAQQLYKMNCINKMYCWAGHLSLYVLENKLMRCSYEKWVHCFYFYICITNV